MARSDLERRCKEAILRIADTVKDIDAKLSHLIEYGLPDRYGGYRHRGKGNGDREQAYAAS
jgi:hypothetical protein